MFRAAAEGMQERGKAKLGDKTILDAIFPAADAPLPRPWPTMLRWPQPAASRWTKRGRPRRRHPVAQPHRPRRLGGRAHRRQSRPGVRDVGDGVGGDNK
ncbi:MAG: hypothetical protein R2838_09935 [Caldilineaceae bacterium]